jgi:hypothetical protein
MYTRFKPCPYRKGDFLETLTVAQILEDVYIVEVLKPLAQFDGFIIVEQGGTCYDGEGTEFELKCIVNKNRYELGAFRA